MEEQVKIQKKNVNEYRAIYQTNKTEIKRLIAELTEAKEKLAQGLADAKNVKDKAEAQVKGLVAELSQAHADRWIAELLLQHKRTQLEDSEVSLKIALQGWTEAAKVTSVASVVTTSAIDATVNLEIESVKTLLDPTRMENLTLILELSTIRTERNLAQQKLKDIPLLSVQKSLV